MANFNVNTWYQVANTLFASSSFGSGFGDDAGAVYFRPTNASAPSQQWQILTLDENTYTFRTRGLGSAASLSSFCQDSSFCANTTSAGMHVESSNDIREIEARFKWSLFPARDGTFYMTNQANGTSWFLLPRGDGKNSVHIVGGITDHRWSFSSISPIDDPQFLTSSTSISTADSASATETALDATNTSSVGASEPSSTGTSDDSSGGLSSGAGGAIGGAIGGFAILVAMIAYFLVRRRKRTTSKSKIEPWSKPELASDNIGSGKQTQKYPRSEPVELPSSISKLSSDPALQARAVFGK